MSSSRRLTVSGKTKVLGLVGDAGPREMCTACGTRMHTSPFRCLTKDARTAAYAPPVLLPTVLLYAHATHAAALNRTPRRCLRLHHVVLSAVPSAAMRSLAKPYCYRSPTAMPSCIPPNMRAGHTPARAVD